MSLGGFGECLPYHDNKMTLDYEKLDQPTKDSIPEVAPDSWLPGANPAKEEAKRVLGQHLESGSTDGSLATKQLDNYGMISPILLSHFCFQPLNLTAIKHF